MCMMYDKQCYLDMILIQFDGALPEFGYTTMDILVESHGFSEPTQVVEENHAVSGKS